MMDGSRPGSRVVSVNVGATRPVEWHGRTVATAIWKSPVPGPVHVGDLSMAGDQQADLRVHGGADKAVYAYAREDYRWWAGELGHPLEPGTFGENLTVEGIDLHGAVIGEQWQVGSAVLAVTQPRIPCFKLGVRMGDSGFVERFAAAGRPGAYLRVVAPGDVEAGDTVGLSARPAHGLTVGDIAAAYAGDGELLETIAENPDVTADWSVWARRQLARRLAKPSSAR